MDPIDDLLERLPRLRAALGWTQTDLAERVGVHQTTISEWEGRRLYPSRRNEAKLREILAAASSGIAA